jgi:hypothetical protein
MFSNIFREMLSDLEFDLKDWMDKILEYATIYLKAVMGTLDFPLFRLLLPTIGDI